MAQVLLDARTLRVCLNCQGNVPPLGRNLGVAPLSLLGSNVCECPAAPMVERMTVSMALEVVHLWGSEASITGRIFEEWGPMPEGFSWTGDDAA